jgi:hypothetical protein
MWLADDASTRRGRQRGGFVVRAVVANDDLAADIRFGQRGGAFQDADPNGKRLVETRQDNAYFAGVFGNWSSQKLGDVRAINNSHPRSSCRSHPRTEHRAKAHIL